MRPTGVLILLFLLFLNAAAQQAGSWTLTGPDVFPTNISGQIHGLGRVCQVKFHPSDSLKMYAVSASGGLFISTNNGASWQRTGTDQLPPAACSSVCIDYTNDSILYLSTGDPNYYGTDYGIYKSIDGGATWSQSNNKIGYRMALEILMDPADHLSLIAATNDGIWKTYDGGLNWSVKKSGGAFKDMKFKPAAGSRTVYAVTSSEFFRSDDAGETWIQVTNGTAVPGGGSGEGFRIAVTPADTQVVYVGMVKDEGTIIKSADGGYTFTTVYHNPAQSLTGYDSGGGGQGNYNFYLTADPDDANTIYTSSHVVWKSTDGGISWTQLTQWYAVLHTDMHYMEVNPYNHQQLFNANDGGVWLSTNGGTAWTPKSDGLDATEIYHASQSPVRSDLISIGTQDNGELYFSGSTWKCNRGGDWGSRSAFDYANNNKAYYYENGNRRDIIANGGETSYNLPFAPGNNTVIEFSPSSINVAFAASDSIFRTVTLAGSNPVWTFMAALPAPAKAMCIAPFDANIVYVVTDNSKILRSYNAMSPAPVFVMLNTPASTSNGASIVALQSDTNAVYLTCGSKVFRSGDRGNTWTNISYNLPGINIKKIYEDQFVSDESVYIGSAAGVYYKNNLMSSWLDYSLGLPEIAHISDLMMYNDGTAASLLRVSYYGRGVWQSPLNKSLAPVAAFGASETFICPNTTIQFSDQSYGNPIAWSWVFQGGNPSVSTMQHPAVSYALPGTYAVTLTATNAAGSNTWSQTSYITVSGTHALPLSEDFESLPFPAPGWLNFDALQDNVMWKKNISAGGYGLSMACVYFDNFNNDVSGSHDELRTPRYNLQNIINPLITFDVAYARYDAGYSDTLAVLVSTDCGATFTEAYVKGGTMLATSPDVTGGTFVPDSTQWRTDSVDLSAWAGLPDVFISFQNRAHYGQALYIDNINLNGISNVAPVAAFTADNLSVCAGEDVTFFDQSSGLATSWSWNFPGGIPSTSNLQNPVVKYPADGTYDASLFCSNGFGADSVTQNGFIMVHILPSVPSVTLNADTLFCSTAFTYQWYQNGLTIGGATASFYIPQQDGNYSCSVRDSNGCSAYSPVVSVVINAVAEYQSAGDIQLYPNPNNGYFLLNLNEEHSDGSMIEIYNMTGEQIYRKAVVQGSRTHVISIPHVVQGIYTLRMIIQGRNVVKRFVVE
jgi:PKD repeat protein